jgi:hypothetical protein
MCAGRQTAGRSALNCEQDNQHTMFRFQGSAVMCGKREHAEQFEAQALDSSEVN